MPEATVVAKDEMKRYLPYLGMFRYIRNSFWTAGQDSFTLPPAQNEDMLELLLNVQPIMQGTLIRRWGYALWAATNTLLFQPVRLILYQRDADGERAVVACEESVFTSTVFFPYKEDGTPLLPVGVNGVVSPGVANPPTNVRAVSSRDWFYTNTWDGTYHYKWGGSSPAIAPVVTNSGSGSITGTFFYSVAYVDKSGVTHGLSPNTSLVSSANAVLIPSPPAQLNMVSYVVEVSSTGTGGFFPQATTPIGTDTTISSLTLSGTSAVIDETMEPMGAIAPANAPIFSFSVPSGAVRTVTDGVLPVNTNDLSSATAAFTVSDIGATVSIAGAGISATALFSTITYWVSATQVTISDLASTGVTSASTTITDLPQRTVSDMVTTAGSQIITSATAAFLPTDVGSRVYIAGAGTNTYQGITILGWFIASITSVTNSTTVVLDVAALNSVSGATAYIVSTGFVNLSVGRIYFAVFQSTLTGHVSDLSPASVSTGPLTNSQVVVNVSTAVIGPATEGMDLVVLLATVDGGDELTLFKVAQGPVATTTLLTDGLPETILLNQPVYSNVDSYGNFFGAVGNTPPPVQMTSFLKHQGRIFGYAGQNIYFSKSISECLTSSGTLVGRYEECWPANYFFDISQGAENVRAHFSDGTVYYIGTERSVRRLIGNTPLAGTTGTTFQEPEVIFNDIGVVSPDVWQPVYNAGQPIGTIWLSPDLRVVLSDFNSYQDIGHPVQDVLNTTNTAQVSQAFAIFASRGPYDIYILGIPTGTNTSPDTLLVYNLRTGKWVVWVPTNLITAMLFNITESGDNQVLASVIDSAFDVVQFGDTYPNDNVTVEPAPPPYRPVPGSFPVSIQTSWLSLQDISLRKVLNQLEVISGSPGGLRISVWGANSQADFASPFLIASSVQPTESVLGSYFIYLAGYASVYRYFKIRFDMSQLSQESNILEGFNLEAVPFNRE